MANQIEIDIVARDLASGILNGITSKLGAIGDVIKGLGPLGLGAIGAGFQFISQAVNETIGYIDKVDEFSRSIGTTAEESARLIQASERLSISQNNLQAALEFAAKKGMDVSIEGLRKLAEQYIAIQDPAERAAFLMKTFGTNGDSMGKMLELGADGINKAMDAINDSLVPTEEAIQATKDYEAAAEELQDIWMGVKVTIGSSVIPTLGLLVRSLTVGKDEVEIHTQAVNRLEMQYDRAMSAAALGSKAAAEDVERLRIQIEILNGTFGDGAEWSQTYLDNIRNGIDTVTGVAPPAVEAIGEVEDALRSLDSVDVNIGSKIQQDIENLQFLSAGGGLVQQIESRIQEAWEAGAITDEEATAMFQQAYLAAQGIAIEMGASKDAIIANIMEVFGVTLGEATALIDAWLADADGKTFNLTAKINYEMGSPDAFSSSQLLWDEITQNKDLNGNGIIGKAYGGFVPGNKPVLVGERGPELIVPNMGAKVIPNNQLGGGGGVEIDYDRFARIIAQEFQKVSR